MDVESQERMVAPHSPLAFATGLALAALLIFAATGAGLLMAPRWGISSVALLYLPPVIITARYFGLRSALVAALGAALAFNYFFTEPYRTLRIASPADAVTVVMLFAVALVISQLAASLRRQAMLAQAHAARNATIAGLAHRLLACRSAQAIADVVVADLARLFDCHALFAVGAGETGILARSPEGSVLAPSDHAALASALSTGEAAGRGVRRADAADWQFRPISSDQGVVAAVGLARPDGKSPVDETRSDLLDNLLDQAALAIDRARLEAEARESAAMRERDRMRAVLLASIGEEVKPGVLAILAGVRKLRRDPADREAVAGLAGEAQRLERYIDNLVDVSPVSDQEPVVVGPLAIDLFRRSVHRDGELVHLTPKEFAVLAELARHAGRVLTHAQLLRAVWGPAHESHVDYLRVAISALRQKLEETPDRPALIVNEPAVGYRLAMQT